ncbi:MAG TPA: glycosyltransferase family 4 protein [Tepidisphaeraceae bacterium]
MKLAYLINQYPQPSQSFIRREILAHEAAGVPVARYTVRRFDGKLADAQDIAERDATRVLLSGGKFGLLKTLLSTAIKSFAAFRPALKLAIKNGRTADRGGVLLHLIYLAEACVLLEQLRADPVDHVHAHFGTNSTTVAMLCHLLGGPTYSFTVHGPEEFDRARGDGLALFDKVKHSQFAVTISEFGRGQLMRWTDSADWPKIAVVRCGLDSVFLDAPAVPVPSVPRVVCVGRLVEQKAQLILVQAVKLLKDRGVPIELRLIGDGPMRGQIERLVAENGLANEVVLLGSKSAQDVRQEMLASRIVTQPSLAEGLPVAVMEALALRRAVVSTQIAAIPELIDDGCGWIIPPGSAPRLADALQAALSTSDERLTAMGEEGRRRVLERHRADVEAQRLRDAIGLRDAIAGPPKGQLDV